MTVYSRPIPATNFRDVRFLQKAENGMIAGLPASGPPNDDDDNNDDDEPCAKKPKLMTTPWEDDKGIFMWFDWKNELRNRDKQYWIDMFRSIIKLAPNLEVCVLHADHPAQQYQHSSTSASGSIIGLPIKALAVLMGGMPKLKKLDLRCLNFVGTTSDYLDFQKILAKYCPQLEELYYYGCPTTPSCDNPEQQQQQKALLADCLLSVRAPTTLKRLSLDGISITKSNVDVLRNIETTKSMENLEFLKLHHVECDWEVLMSLASAVKTMTKLTHFNLSIGGKKTGTGASPSSSSSSVEEVALRNSIQLLTEALSTPPHRLFVLELQIHSSLLLTTSLSSSGNKILLQPWVDLLKQNYSCHKFSLTTILDDDGTVYDPNDNNEQNNNNNNNTSAAAAAAAVATMIEQVHRDAQVYIKLNRERRNRLLSHFQPGLFVSSTSSQFYMTILEGLGSTSSSSSSSSSTPAGSGRDSDLMLEEQDLVTGLYHFIHENVGEIASLLLLTDNNNNSNNNKKSNQCITGSGVDDDDDVSSAKLVAAVATADAAAGSTAWDEEKMPSSNTTSPSPPPSSATTTAMAVAAAKPSGPMARAVTNSPVPPQDSSFSTTAAAAVEEMMDTAAAVVPPLDGGAAAPTPPNRFDRGGGGDNNENGNNNGNVGITDTTTASLPFAGAAAGTTASATTNQEEATSSSIQESPPPKPLTHLDVTLGRRPRGPGSSSNTTKPPTTATTCWINIVRGSRQHFPTIQNCLDAHRNLVFLATGSGGGGRRDRDVVVVRFYIALNRAYNNRHWVQDWNDKRTDGETVFVRANDVCVKHDIDCNDLRGAINRATATVATASSSSKGDGKKSKGNAAAASVKEITETQRARALKESKYATCLIELAAKEKASTTLWAELAKAKQSYSDGDDETDDGVDEYAGWVDVLARDYTDRASNMAMLTEVKKSLDATLDRAKFMRT